MRAPTTAEAAQWYVERGWAVYPASADKRALVRGWNGTAAAHDPERARFYFEKEFPSAALGIACTPSDLVVVDIDPRNGGHASFAALAEAVGVELFEGTPTVTTPGGGSHLYFKAPAIAIRSGAHLLGPGIDVVAAGGGVLAPPSARGERAYSWHDPNGFPESLEIYELPDVLVQRIRAKVVGRAAKALGDRLTEAITAGERNATLTRYAGKLRWRLGLNEVELAGALLAINAERCQPPLNESEVRMIAKSVAAYATGEEPLLWLDAWLPHIATPNEARVATALAILAECIAGPLTPAGSVMEARTGLRLEKYYGARKRLEDCGAIRVLSRGRKLAPVIELLSRSKP